MICRQAMVQTRRVPLTKGLAQILPAMANPSVSSDWSNRKILTGKIRPVLPTIPSRATSLAANAMCCGRRLLPPVRWKVSLLTAAPGRSKVALYGYRLNRSAAMRQRSITSTRCCRNTSKSRPPLPWRSRPADGRRILMSFSTTRARRISSLPV